MTFEENKPTTFKFENDGDEVTGVLLNTQKNVGEHNASLYTLEVEEVPVQIWGSAILDQRMVGVKVGDLIKIEFKGLGEAQPGQNAPRIFAVYIDR